MITTSELLVKVKVRRRRCQHTNFQNCRAKTKTGIMYLKTLDTRAGDMAFFAIDSLREACYSGSI